VCLHVRPHVSSRKLLLLTGHHNIKSKRIVLVALGFSKNILVLGYLALYYLNIIYLTYIHIISWSRCSSVSIVSGYGLDDRAIKARSPAEAKDFSSSLCVQTRSEAHPASCTMGTGGPFPGGKARPGRDADHSPPSTAEVKNE
jgi:hypothetical protein